MGARLTWNISFDEDHPLETNIREFHVTLYYPDIKAKGKEWALMQIDRFDEMARPLDHKSFYVRNDFDLRKWFNVLDIVDLRQMYDLREGKGILPSMIGNWTVL